jgi:wyosine [tRNA(Phe)-imidazoG37] synthetase (radical SAM superfamily)
VRPIKEQHKDSVTPSPPHPVTPSSPWFASHPRTFAENHYVYPVVSRRAGGISIGVNLNLDKVCNFHCIYCQVDRDHPADGARPGEKDFVEIGRLDAELDAMVRWVTSGRIYEDPSFSRTPDALRRLNDIALSGDGEPTSYGNFDEVASVCADVRRRHGLDGVKLVLITNASMFHRPRVQRGLEILDAANGEIWAKLDAGTQEYYRLVAASAIPFQRILDNLLSAARVRPIVIQSLFMRIRGQPPPPAEQAAYCDRLNEITSGGGRIKLVQVHTIARPPAENYVTALSNAEVDALAALVRERTGLTVAAFYGH